MTMVTATICGTALGYLASSWLNGKNFTKLVEWPVVDSVPWHSNVGLGTKNLCCTLPSNMWEFPNKGKPNIVP